MANERIAALRACRQFLYDLDPEAPLIDEDVIKLHLDSGLAALSEWRPLRKMLTLTLDVTQNAYDLPPDFIAIEPDSFNTAVGIAIPGRQAGLPALPGLPSIFPLDTLTLALSSRAFFPPNSRFDFAQKDDGAPVLYTTPKPVSAGDLQFLYQANHKITDDTGVEPDVVAGVNTVAIRDRDLLWLKVGELCAISMERKLAGDRYASRNFANLAERCSGAFEKRAAVFTWSS